MHGQGGGIRHARCDHPQLPASPPANDYGGYTGSAANHHHVYDNVLDVLLRNGEVATPTEQGLEGGTIEQMNALASSVNGGGGPLSPNTCENLTHHIAQTQLRRRRCRSQIRHRTDPPGFAPPKSKITPCFCACLMASRSVDTAHVLTLLDRQKRRCSNDKTARYALALRVPGQHTKNQSV